MAPRNVKTGTIVVMAANACCGLTSAVAPLEVLAELYPNTAALT